MKPKEPRKEPERRPETEKKSVTLTAEQLAAYAGDYWSQELGITYRLGVEGSNLKVVAIVDGSGTVRTDVPIRRPFAATGDNEFAVERPRFAIHFQRDAHQALTGFTLDAGRTRGMIFSRKDGSGK